MSRAQFLIAILLGTGACSFMVTRADPCRTHEDCRAGFGWGSTCNEGFCSAPAPPRRCTQTFPDDLFEDPDRYRDATVFGALFDDDAHLDSFQATQLAVLEANQAGGFDGEEIAFVLCDYGEHEDDELDSIEASVTGALWLTDTLGATAIAGPRGSSRTKAAFLALEERDVLLISPSATSPELTEIDVTAPTDEDPGLLWRTVPPDGLQATVIVGDLESRGVGTLAIIAQEGSYGDALSTLVAAGFEQATGGTATVFPYTNSPFGAVADVGASGADEVVFISSDIADYVDFLGAAVASDNLLDTYDAMGLFLTDAAFNLQLLEDASPDAHVLFDNIRGTRPAPAEGPLFDAFSGAFATEFGADPQSSGFTVHSYDAAWLILYAHAWARANEADTGGRSLARGLRRLSAGAPFPIRPSSWTEIKDAFARGDSVDISGGSGELDFDPDTEETSAPIEIWGIEGSGPGEFEFVAIQTVG